MAPALIDTATRSMSGNMVSIRRQSTLPLKRSSRFSYFSSGEARKNFWSFQSRMRGIRWMPNK